MSKTNAADQGNEQDQACECSTGEHCSASELEDCHRQKPTDGGGQLPDNCPDGDCEHLEQRCPDACPDTCEDDGECPAVVCPESCPGHCDSSGECLIENVCPAECPDSCDEEGFCPQETACPAECPDSCDEEGLCPQETACPAECPDSCDEEGLCPQETACPSECPDSCDEEGLCPQEIVCPPECLDSCGEDGTCPSIPECPENCQNECDADGVCLCSSSCKSTCDADGVCQCPASCKSTCNDDGVCLCPESCKSTCNDDGVCLCPESCKSTCSPDGVCQCPASCPKTCNENGECPVLCGNETVKSMRFSYKELDILMPGSKGRTIDDEMKVFIKTDKKEYSIDEAPCKGDIQLNCEDPSIVKVGRNQSDPSRAKFTAVGVGTTTCSVTIKGQTGMKGAIKLHVLNLDRLHNVLSNKNLYKGPLRLYADTYTTRVSQGYDFYNDQYVYFSQLLGNNAHNRQDGHNDLYIFKNYYSNSNSNPMIFPASGHGQNLSVEKTDGKDYLWFGSYGSLKCATCDGYVDSRTIARVEWDESKSGQYLYPSDIKEHYYYDDLIAVEPAIDAKNNRFAFRGKKGKTTYVKIYRFSDVKKAGEKKVTLNNIIWYKKGSEQSKSIKNVLVKDLSAVSSLKKFSRSKIPVQGMEIENGIIYTVGDKRAKLKTPDGKYNYVSEIYLYVYDYGGNDIAGKGYFDSESDEGKYVYYLGTTAVSKRKKKTVSCENKNKNYCTGYFLENAKLDSMLNFDEGGIHYEHNGYLEAEGIRVSDGKLYLSVTVEYKYKNKSGKTARSNRQVIFVYDLAK